MADKKRKFYGTGRRKSSSARVTLVPGTGKITVNGRDVHEYMPHEVLEYDDTDNGSSEGETSYRAILKKNGFITRDARKKERKKPGLKEARRAPQFSKR